MPHESAAATLALVASVAFVAGAPAPAGAQGTRPALTRSVTTIPALTTYPAFFNTQPVRVRGEIGGTDTAPTLTAGEAVVVLAGRTAVAAAATPGRQVEVTGTFLDVARVPAGDPRLRDLDIERLSEERLGKPAPGSGELLVLIAETIDDADPRPAPSIRAVALDPWRFLDERVTLTGRFRGRNLYGEQPNAPGTSRWDFVLQSADASIWVTGMRPRGRGFNFDINSRLDTERWLEASGTVRLERGLVVLEAAELREAEPIADTSQPEAIVRVPVALPPPEVIFSAPTEGETDVALDTTVRIQFSRDMDPTTFAGQVRVRYLGQESAERGEAAPPPVQVSTSYDGGRRVLELRFSEPLQRFRTLEVELRDGITSIDGQPLVPWTLRFGLGG